MNLPSAIFAIRCLVWDTFRQARANGILWLMLGVSGLCIAFCLGVDTVDLPLRPTYDTPERLPGSEAAKLSAERLDQSGVDVIKGKITFAFGAVVVEDWTKYRNDAVRYLEQILLGLVADTGGILLALVWTAAFLPTFLEPHNAAVLLAKPTPRWLLLVGKFLGVIAFVAFQATVFVGGIWGALGIKTGVWDGVCWLAVPVLLYHFAVFFSFSALLAVLTRSTVACVFGSLLFWFLCLGMNLGRHYVWTLDALRTLPDSFVFLADAGYWILPKPSDLGVLLTEALHAQHDYAAPFDLAALARRGAWHPEMAILSSGLFALAMLGMAGRELAKTDY